MRTPLPRRVPWGSGVHISPRGFTLVEMMLVLIVIGFIAGIMAPILVNPYRNDNHLETVKEMGAIVDAIYGRGDLGEYGYLATMGQLPPVVTQTGTMADLYEPPAGAPVPLTQVGALNFGGVPGGWNGPYLRSYAQEPSKDAWGIAYRFTTNFADSSQWRLSSAGPDRTLGTGDDIVLPGSNSWYASAGELDVELYVASPQRRLMPLPDDVLAPRSGSARTPLVPVVYLPISSSNARVACNSAALDGRCTAVCKVVDADGKSDQFASNNAKSPFRIACSAVNGSGGMPFGVHHLSLAFASAQPLFADGARTFEANLLVNRPKALTRLVVPADLLPTTTTPSWTLSTTAANSAAPVTIATGKTTSLDAQTQGVNVTVRFSGTISVTDATTQCALELQTSDSTGLPLSPAPPKITLQSPAAAVTTAPSVPFSYEYTLRRPQSSPSVDLSALKLVLTRVSASGTCTPSINAATLRYVQR